MNILFFHTPSDLYGASRSLLRLSTRLINENHNVLVVLSQDGPLYNELIDNNIDCIIKEYTVISRQNIKNVFRLVVDFIPNYKSICEIVKKFKPTIIHSNTALMITPAMVAKRYKIKHIWHIREFFSEFSYFWLLLQWIYYFFSDRIVCVSNAVANQFNSFIYRNKVSVIHNGFPLHEFENIDDEALKKIKKRFNLDKATIVGIVGRIKYKRKGQEIFVKAVKLIENKVDNVKFLIIGSPFPGNEKHLEDLKVLIKELDVENKIIFTGDVKDNKIAIGSLDISILASSLPEPFGGVVIESMAMKKPVIGTNIGGTPEQIDDGVTGVLVNPDNPEELADAILKLIKDEKLRLRMGQEGYNKYFRQFEFEAFYKQIEKLYQTI